MKVHLEKKKGEEKAGVEVALYRIKSVLDNKVKQEGLWAQEVVRLNMACEEHARELALVLGLEMSGREVLEGLDLETKTLEVPDEG